MSDVYMQTTSGKVKLATAEEVDNMASSISGGLGGTLVGTTCARIEKINLNVSLPVSGDYVIVKSLTLSDFSDSYSTCIRTNAGITLLYKGGTGYIAPTFSSTSSSTASPSAIVAAEATFNASGTSIDFKSNLGVYDKNTYVNIEIYKLK